MKHITTYKLYEETNKKPVRKFPTDPAAHWNYIYEIVEEAGLDPHQLEEGRDKSLQDFFFEKCSKGNVVFPNMVDSEGWDDKSDSRYEKFIFRNSVFLIPESYDNSNDFGNSVSKKLTWMEKMKKMMRPKYNDKELEDFMNNLEKHTHFGNDDWGWVNPALKAIHDKLGSHYIEGKLRVWMPQDRDYDTWEGVDYPHKYSVTGRLENPNGVYYLSDIEKYIDNIYGLKDTKLYDFIIECDYIEGRYWEIMSVFPYDDDNIMKLDKERGSENINDIMGAIEHEFGNEIIREEGLPVYIDYFKKLKPL
jgi:hypothetical protein